MSLFEALQENETLRTLLVGCNLGMPAANLLRGDALSALFRALRDGSKLRKIVIRAGELSDKQMTQLGGVLGESKILRGVDIAETAISREGVRILVKSLESNFTLSSLKIDSAGLEPNQTLFLRKRIEANVASSLVTRLIVETACRECALRSLRRLECSSRRMSVKADTTLMNPFSSTDKLFRTTSCASVHTISTRRQRIPSLWYLSREVSWATDSPSCWRSGRFLVGHSQTIGKRPSMEDVSKVRVTFRQRESEGLFELFDGHGGRLAAIVAALHLHEYLADALEENEENPSECLLHAFCDTNQAMIRDGVSDGTTALVVYIRGRALYCANCGDTRAVLSRGGVAIRLSLDHVPSLPEEADRIERSGGFVSMDNRVNGVLAVSRALGDVFLQPAVTPEPTIREIVLEDGDELLILACDGLWDVVRDQQAVDIALQHRNALSAATCLRDAAFARGSEDNISVIVVQLLEYGGPMARGESAVSLKGRPTLRSQSPKTLDLDLAGSSRETARQRMPSPGKSTSMRRITVLTPMPPEARDESDSDRESDVVEGTPREVKVFEGRKTRTKSVDLHPGEEER